VRPHARTRVDIPRLHLADVVRAGANVLVAGSAVFKDRTPESYRNNIAAIRHAAVVARGEVA